MSQPLYDYGPPVTTTGGGTPAVTTGEVENGGSDGGSPHTPVGAAIQAPAGGSPTEESGKKYASTTTSIAPTTIANTGADTVCTITGTNFSPGSKAVYGGQVMATTYVSPTSLTFVLPVVARVTTGVVTVGVQTGALLTNTVNFTYT